MLTSRLDRLFSLAAGCSVLLLLTAQQKLCPWLHEAPAEQATRSADAKGALPASDDLPDATATEGPPEHQAPRLPLLLPDSRNTFAPRSPAGSARAEAQQAVGWRDGVLAAGPRHDNGDEPDHTGDTLVAQWRDLQCPIPCAGGPVDHLHRGCPLHPALHSCILRTGPPRA